MSIASQDVREVGRRTTLALSKGKGPKAQDSYNEIRDNQDS